MAAPHNKFTDEQVTELRCNIYVRDVTRSNVYFTDEFNNDRYQWDLAKLAPAEYYRYSTTGEYPLTVLPPLHTTLGIMKTHTMPLCKPVFDKGYVSICSGLWHNLILCPTIRIPAVKNWYSRFRSLGTNTYVSL
jgi:hypothetical protein